MHSVSTGYLFRFTIQYINAQEPAGSIFFMETTGQNNNGKLRMKRYMHLRKGGENHS